MRKTKSFLTLFFASLFLILTFGVLSGCKEKNADVTTYVIDCELNGNELTARQEVSFFNHTDNAFKELKFNLFANAFREGANYKPIADQYLSRAYPNGINYGGIEILSVKSGDENLSFSIDGEDKNVLTVQLALEVYPNERANCVIEFKTILSNVIARTGINDDTINLANFYPILCGIENGGFFECVYYSTGDPFFSDVASYEVTLCCKDTFTVASSGKLDGKVKVNNGTKTATYKIERARNFAFVLSEKFSVASTKYGEVEIFYYYFDDERFDKSLDVAKKSVEFFSQKFGSYPHATYSVCQTKFIQGGMEFSALTMISDELEERAYNEVIIHETAHMWWMSAVGNNELKYGFLDEGLTEYSVILFYEAHPEFNLTREALITSSEKTFRAFCSVYDKLYNKVDTSMLRPLGEYSSEYEYVNIAYVKPCIMYDTLRKTVGEEKFFSALKNYYSLYAFKVATPDCLVGEFEKVGASANGYFESFFNGKVII